MRWIPWQDGTKKELAGAIIGGLTGRAASLTKSVIQNGFDSIYDSKTWQKAGVNALGGAIVGATGGIAGAAGLRAVATTVTGSVATAVTSFGTSIAEDKIEGKQVDYAAATASSLLAITGSIIIIIQIVVLFMLFLIPGLFLVRWYYKHKRH